MNSEAEAKALFVKTRDAHGWAAPEWDELAPETREMYYRHLAAPQDNSRIAGIPSIDEVARWLEENSTDAVRDVLAERERQVSKEGWTPEHDDAHAEGEMAEAAAAYATGNGGIFPWAAKWWKPTTERRNLVKAGALILAEIERIDRLLKRAGLRRGK